MITTNDMAIALLDALVKQKAHAAIFHGDGSWDSADTDQLAVDILDALQAEGLIE